MAPLTQLYSNNHQVRCGAPLTPLSTIQFTFCLCLLKPSAACLPGTLNKVAWMAKKPPDWNLNDLARIHSERSLKGFSSLCATSCGDAETAALVDLPHAQKGPTTQLGGSKVWSIKEKHPKPGRCDREIFIVLAMSQRYKISVFSISGYVSDWI